MIKNLIFLGAPGVGKGTVAKVIASKTGLIHLSTGEIFREAIRNETPLGKQLKEIVEKGLYVSDEITNEIVRSKIDELSNEGKNFILDGYPRTENQASFLEKLSNHNLQAAILLEASQDLIVQRLSKRRYCPVCHSTYHLEFKPSKNGLKCENDNEILLQREDDTKEAIIKRLEIYEAQTKVLIKFYEDRGLLVKINAISDPDSLANDIINKLNN